MKSEAERTKRFVKGLKLEIRGRLISLQLRNYLQAVEEALEVEMNIQESQEDWAKELSSSKRSRYQGPSVSVAPGSTSSKGFGFNVTLQRGGWARGRGIWLRNREIFLPLRPTPESRRPLDAKSVR